MSATHILKRDDLTLGGRLVSGLREAILSGSLEPGRHLKDRELCEMFGVSRTLVREAVQTLAAEELIEIVPHRGPVVATLDRRTVAELYRVRGVLEGLACAEFAVNADERGRQALSAIVDDLSALTGREGPVRRGIALRLEAVALLDEPAACDLLALFRLLLGLDLKDAQILLCLQQLQRVRGVGRRHHDLGEDRLDLLSQFQRDLAVAGDHTAVGGDRVARVCLLVRVRNGGIGHRHAARVGVLDNGHACALVVPCRAPGGVRILVVVVAHLLAAVLLRGGNAPALGFEARGLVGILAVAQLAAGACTLVDARVNPAHRLLQLSRELAGKPAWQNDRYRSIVLLVTMAVIVAAFW